MTIRDLSGIACGILLLLGGCADPDDTSTGSEPSPSESSQSGAVEPSPPTESTPSGRIDLRRAVQRLSDEMLDGDAEGVMALLTSQCQTQITVGEMASVAALSDVFSTPLPIRTFRAEIDGIDARVTYTFSGAPGLGRRDEPWQWDPADGWQHNGCAYGIGLIPAGFPQ